MTDCTKSMSPGLQSRLACPYDGTRLLNDGRGIRCENAHKFPLVEGIPVLLRQDVEQTHGEAKRTLEIAQLDNVAELLGVVEHIESVNRHVQKLVASTCGFLYLPLVGQLPGYPVPELRLPFGAGRTFLEVGCSWGRWVIAAAHSGYRPVGIDPSLGAILVAQQVCRQIGIKADFVVGDARYLPFADDSFDTIFSYSVLQHLSRENVRIALQECRRVITPGGRCLIQMPN